MFLMFSVTAEQAEGTGRTEAPALTESHAEPQKSTVRMLRRNHTPSQGFPYRPGRQDGTFCTLTKELEPGCGSVVTGDNARGAGRWGGQAGGSAGRQVTKGRRSTFLKGRGLAGLKVCSVSSSPSIVSVQSDRGASCNSKLSQQSPWPGLTDQPSAQDGAAASMQQRQRRRQEGGGGGPVPRTRTTLTCQKGRCQSPALQACAQCQRQL